MSKTLVNEFKRNHPRKTMFGGREMYAYNVPGTTENGGLVMAQTQPEPPTYSVVVRDPNSWDAKTGIHCLLRDCGHAHRSLAAAAHCHAKLTKVTGQWGNGGTTSAAWFHAVVESSTGEQFSNYELFEALNQ